MLQAVKIALILMESVVRAVIKTDVHIVRADMGIIQVQNSALPAQEVHIQQEGYPDVQLAEQERK